MEVGTQCRLFAGAVFVALALLTLPGRWALLGLLWGFVVFPLGVAGAERVRRRRSGDAPSRDIDYWRTTDWGSGRR